MFGYKIALLLTGTIIFPTIVGIVHFRRFPMHCKLIVMLLSFGFFAEFVLIILPHFGINNFFSSHVYALGEIILLSLFFIIKIKGSKEKRVVKFLMVGLSVFALLYSFIGNNIAEFNSIPRALECIYFSALSCYLFYEMALDPNPVDDSIHFINGAIFFYFSSCFIVFAFSRYIPTDNNNLLVMHNAHSIVNAMCNIAYARGLWIASRSSYSVA